MAPPYLVHVTSSPTTVPATVWAQVHADQHLPDLVNSQTCERAGFYREISGPNFSSRRPAQGNPPSFLALYHTVFAEPLTTENYARGVRPASDLFRQAGSADDTIKGNAHLDARNYILVGECGRCETTGEKGTCLAVLSFSFSVPRLPPYLSLCAHTGSSQLTFIFPCRCRSVRPHGRDGAHGRGGGSASGPLRKTVSRRASPSPF